MNSDLFKDKISQNPILKKTIMKLQEDQIADNIINEASAVWPSELPEEWKQYKKIGQGKTSIVLEKDPNTVVVITRDPIKVDWVALNLGKNIREIEPKHKKNYRMRDMTLFSYEMPKLKKISNSFYNNKILPEINIFYDNYVKRGSYLGDAYAHFIEDRPDSFLTPLFTFLTDYYDDQYLLDMHSGNFMVDDKNNIYVTDPIINKEVWSLIR